MKRRVVAGVAATLVVASAGCENAERREARLVLDGVDHVRHAPSEGLGAAVVALKKTSCQAPMACSTRDACVASGEATARAIALKDEVAHALAAVDAGTLAIDSAEARSLAPKLDEAEASLKKGLDLMYSCDGQAQALARKNSL